MPKSNYLPIHMQHQNGRLAITHSGTYNQLRANNFKERPMLDPISTMNTRKDFRVDPKRQRATKSQPGAGGDKGGQKRKNLTFN